MADDKTVAQPAAMIRGGDLTDQVGRLTRDLYESFAARTGGNPNAPGAAPSPFGDDASGKKALATYGPPHTELLDALKSLADALEGAAKMTTGSGANFAKAQNDAVDMI
ncbi:hypothetical protein [Streptomyces sp. NPDC057694]|uniref:hypothetical protein n=1 Tax=Streptomyces sp. NPDC057694 TaxID=3346216 RepID=UPI0036A9ADC9